MSDLNDPPMSALPQDEPESRPGGVPLYVWVLIAVGLAVPIGLYAGESAAGLNILPKLIIRALSALAAPLVVLAILHAIVSNDIRGRQGARMMFYYLVNTLVAMGIGLGLANLIKPGVGAELVDLSTPREPLAKKTVTALITELIPKSLGEAFSRKFA